MRVYYLTMLFRWIAGAIMFMCTDRPGVLTAKTTRTFITNFGDLMVSSQML